MQALLAAGADTAVRNQHGDTALVCASRRGHTAVAAALSGAMRGAIGEPRAARYGTCSLAQLQDACRAKGLPVGGTKTVLRAWLEATAPPLQWTAIFGPYLPCASTSGGMFTRGLFLGGARFNMEEISA